MAFSMAARIRALSCGAETPVLFERLQIQVFALFLQSNGFFRIALLILRRALRRFSWPAAYVPLAMIPFAIVVPPSDLGFGGVLRVLTTL